jgi:hypothetical protein
MAAPALALKRVGYSGSTFGEGGARPGNNMFKKAE